MRISYPGTRIAAKWGVWEQHRQQIHDSPISNSFQSPRYVPDSGEPWTQYSSVHDQSHEPSPSENLFAPGDSPTQEARYSSQCYPGAVHPQGESSSVANQHTHPSCVSLRSSRHDVDVDDVDDTVGEPPSSNPVGPPLGDVGGLAQVSAVYTPDVKKKGGRIGKLDSQAKANANSKRSAKDTCWHCRMLRSPVCRHDLFGNRRKLSSDGQCPRVEGSDMCDRCKSMRPSGWPWGCLIQHLPDLTDAFLPGRNISGMFGFSHPLTL